jgi:5-methyltetrahydrofolate--homocysteine methyltransferase
MKGIVMNINWNELNDSFIAALLDEEKEDAIEIAREALGKGATPEALFESCVTPSLVEIGARFERLEIFLPEMVAAAEVVQAVNDQVIQPTIVSSGGEGVGSQGKVVLATVEGDLHDIGKNMVNLMLRVNGFEVIDLGVNVSAEEIVKVAEGKDADVIGLSSLLTSCLPYMKDVVELLQAKRLREQFEVIIGGAAPTAEFAESVGFDAQGHTAAEAVTICKSLLAGVKE